ncbi:MAG: autotransporter-associated beta strand repeat-containing protein, partial [Phycisphaerae bacterium]|nr:autotransporter-associated beta strand repeat-containing protein [Phycisphaerae bacterium]
MRNTLVIVCALALLVGAGPTWGAEDGYRWQELGDGNWATAGNWQVDDGSWSGDPPVWTENWVTATSLPTIDNYVDIPILGNPNPVPYEYTITINSAGAAADVIEFNRTNTRLLLTTGGELSVYGAMTSYRGVDVGDKAGGVFEIAGGTANISGFRHGRWSNNYEHPATVKISGGQLLPYYRTDLEEWLDEEETIPNPNYLKIGDAGFHSGERENRSAIIHIVGQQADNIKILGGESSGAPAWDLRRCATLIAEVDGTAQGITTIECDTTVSANLLHDVGDNATFTNGGVIDITGTAPTLGTSHTLLTADYISNTSVVLAEDDQRGTSTWTDGNYWVMVINRGTESGLAANNGDNASVVVTYIAPDTFSDLYWDTNGTTAGIGGTGNWDTATTNWSETEAGTGPMDAWSNTSADKTIANVIQSVVDQTVTLTTGITASEIKMSAPGAMTITGNTLTLVAPYLSGSAGSPKLTTLTSDTDVTIASTVAGSAGLTKAGDGKVTLTAANTYTGKTFVTGGTLVVANNAALGATGAGNGTEASGGALGLPGGIELPVGEDLFIADTGILNMAGDNTIKGDITTIASYATISAASGSKLTVDGNVDIAKYRLTVVGGGTVEFNGVISGTDGANIEVGSTGTTVILNNDNTFNGYVYVWWGSNRKVIITHDNALGTAGNEGGHTQIGRSYHTLGLMGDITCAEELRIGYRGNSDGAGGYVGVIENISGDNTLTGAVKIIETYNNDTRIGATSGTLTITQGITSTTGNAENLMKVGAGTLILNGANTYTGDTIVN